MVYCLYSISWVVIGGIVKQLLAVDDGLFNNILAGMGKDRVAFLQNSSYFYQSSSSPNCGRAWDGVRSST